MDPFLTAKYFLLACIACVVMNCGGARYEAETARQTTPAQTVTTPANVAPQTEYDFARVDEILRRAAPRLGGVSLLLVKDGQVIYRRAFGQRTLDDAVPIASASKWLAAAAVLSLVDEGKLSLDDPVSKHLPEFTRETAKITVRQLFSHTSGLPPEANCRNDKRTTLEACVKEISRVPLRAAPGSEFYYGGVSFQVGGRIAEVVSGKSWNDLFVERIAAPLGMTRTDFYAYGETRNPRPAGDARSSLDDYGRFETMILQQGKLNGRRVLSRESVAEMLRDQTNGVPIRYTIYEKHGDLDPALPLARYGLGVWRERVDDPSGKLTDNVTAGLIEASSQGALGFSPWIDLERNLAGVLLTNSTMSRVMPVYLEVKEAIRQTVPE